MFIRQQEIIICSDFLNNFEFIATTIDEYNYDILINDNASLFNKLSDFISKGTKIYVSANKLLEIANDGTILTPKQTKAINDFYKNQFGVVSVDKKSNIETPLTIKGIDSNIDTTKYSLYGNETGHFVDYFNINTPNIASGIFTTETDNKIVAVKANNAYDDKKIDDFF